jgi:hypothetical protein
MRLNARSARMGPNQDFLVNFGFNCIVGKMHQVKMCLSNYNSDLTPHSLMFVGRVRKKESSRQSSSTNDVWEIQSLVTEFLFCRIAIRDEEWKGSICLTPISFLLNIWNEIKLHSKYIDKPIFINNWIRQHF